MEYCRAHDLPLDHLLVQNAPASPRTLEWMQTARQALVPDAQEYVLRDDPHETAGELAYVGALLSSHAGPVRIVSGGFHHPFLWFLVERYGARIDEVVVVDEGVGSYAATIGDRHATPQIVHLLQTNEIESAHAAFAAFPVTFYSRYPLDHQLLEIDALEPADPAVLREVLRFDASPAAPEIYFVGSPLQMVLTDSSLDIALTSLALHAAKRLHPEAAVVYIPHRDELPEKLEAVATLVEVRPLGHPIELEAIISGVAPRRLATFLSSAAISCAVVDPDVDVDVFVVPGRWTRPEHVEGTRSGLQLFIDLLGEQVVLHDLDAGVPHAMIPPGVLDQHVSPTTVVDGVVVDSTLPVDDLVVILGSNGDAAFQPPDTALAQARAMLAFANALTSSGQVRYVPARGEAAATLSALESVVEVERRDLPPSLLPAEWGVRPRHVVTIRSTWLPAFATDPEGDVTGWVLRAAPSGYELEETAVEVVHRAYREVSGVRLRWETLPEEPYDPAEELLRAQRRHSRDRQALCDRIDQLEDTLAATVEESTTRNVVIGELRRALRSQEAANARLGERNGKLVERNRRLKAEIAALRERLAAAEQEAARRTGLRGLVGRGRPGSKDLD
ncbi:MAG TPA: hypothetical protein VGE38_10615 [Nocardioides sp.]|uniref:hypothetical protein n=1 Tax=Nocardioides sp. TaxID=35761 RepID=UPI002EDAC33E